jgi:hypothetical protein
MNVVSTTLSNNENAAARSDKLQCVVDLTVGRIWKPTTN